MVLLVLVGVLSGFGYYWYNNLRIFDVTFETNEGSEITSMSLYHLQTIPELETPVKEGHAFAGWYTDSDRTEPYSRQRMPMKDVTLYADWGTEGLIFIKLGGSYTVSVGTAASEDILIPKRHQGDVVNAIAYQGFRAHGTYTCRTRY